MRARIAFAVPLALTLPAPAMAQQDTRLSVDVAGTAGYSNNPFAQSGDDTGSALVELDVLPRFQLVTERSALSVAASARLQQYLRRYSRNENYSLAIDHSLRPSERLTAHTRLDLTSAVIGAYDSYAPNQLVPGLAAPGAGGATGVGTGAGTGTGTGTGTGQGNVVTTDPGLLLPPINDIGLFGLRNRRNGARLSGDIGVAISARDSLSLGASGEASRYRGVARVGNYEDYATTLAYSRIVSDTARVGVQGSASLYDYALAGRDSRTFSIEATGSIRIDQYFTAGGALGATFIDGNAIGSTGKTSLSGNANLCRRGERTSMCIQAARQVRPTGLVGTQYVTTAGANWSLQLSERAGVSWSAAYSKVGGSTAILTNGPLVVGNEFATFSTGYNRRLAERLRFVASANVRQIFGGQADRPLDFGGQLGLSFRIGDRR